MKLFIFPIISILFFVGCVKNTNNVNINSTAVTSSNSLNSDLTQRTASGKPIWINGYIETGDKIIGIGHAKQHVNGLTYQRELAISRAIDEIARQKGVKVENTLERMSVANGKTASTNMKSYSIQSVEGAKVNAKVVDLWTDTYTKDIHVLMEAY